MPPSGGPRGSAGDVWQEPSSASDLLLRTAFREMQFFPRNIPRDTVSGRCLGCPKSRDSGMPDAVPSFADFKLDPENREIQTQADNRGIG